MAHGQGGAEIGFDRGPTLTCNHEAPIAAYPVLDLSYQNPLPGEGSNDYWHRMADYERELGITPDMLAGSSKPFPSPAVCVTGSVTHTLKAEGFDASEDGTGRGQPIVAHCRELAQTITSNYGKQVDNSDTALGPNVIAVHGTQDPCVSTTTAFALGRNNGGENAIAIQDVRGTDKAQNGRGWNDDGTAYTLDTHATQGVAHVLAPIAAYAIQAGALRTNPASGPDGVGVQADHAYTLEARAEVQAVAFAQNSRDEVRLMNGDGQIVGALAAEPGMKQTCYVAQPAVTGPVGIFQDSEFGVQKYDTAGTLRAGRIPEHQMAMQPPTMQVRRLTPVECERLQGFPDGYTMIPWRKKPAEDCPDGPRYKALGNSWAVPNVRWIGRRIDAHVRDLDANSGPTARPS